MTHFQGTFVDICRFVDLSISVFLGTNSETDVQGETSEQNVSLPLRPGASQSGAGPWSPNLYSHLLYDSGCGERPFVTLRGGTCCFRYMPVKQKYEQAKSYLTTSYLGAIVKGKDGWYAG